MADGDFGNVVPNPLQSSDARYSCATALLSGGRGDVFLDDGTVLVVKLHT